jgi:hypothetical protein
VAWPRFSVVPGILFAVVVSALFVRREHLVVITRLSPDVLRERLQSRIGPGFAWREAPERPLAGTIGTDGFVVRRWRTRRSLLWPVARGRYYSTADGTRVELSLGQDNLERLLAALLFGAILTVFSPLPEIRIALPLLLLGAVVAYTGICVQSAREIRLLRSLLCDTLGACPDGYSEASCLGAAPTV